MGPRLESPEFLIGPPRPKQPRVSQAKPRKPLPRSRAEPRRKNAIECRPHVDWVLANCRCILAGKVSNITGKVHECWGPLDPHHSPTRGAGGGDDGVSAICRGGHSLLDSWDRSETSVEVEYGVSFRANGAYQWQVDSGNRLAYEREHMAAAE